MSDGYNGKLRVGCAPFKLIVKRPRYVVGVLGQTQIIKQQMRVDVLGPVPGADAASAFFQNVGFIQSAMNSGQSRTTWRTSNASVCVSRFGIGSRPTD